MFDGQIRSRKQTPEVEPHGPSETYAACLKALRQNENFMPACTPAQGPAGLTEMTMFLDIFGPQNA